MNKMIYQSTRLNPPEILCSEEYCGYKFYVLNLGTHPCAYVQIPKGDKLFELTYDDIYKKYDIDCHGGLTYTYSKLSSVEEAGWFIGWDYAHCGDYCGYESCQAFEDQKWSTEEICFECKEVIDQIVVINAQ